MFIFWGRYVSMCRIFCVSGTLSQLRAGACVNCTFCTIVSIVPGDFSVRGYVCCSDNGWSFLEFRVWIGIWVSVFMVIFTATDASALVQYATKFTQEPFAGQFTCTNISFGCSWTSCAPCAFDQSLIYALFHLCIYPFPWCKARHIEVSIFSANRNNKTWLCKKI